MGSFHPLEGPRTNLSRMAKESLLCRKVLCTMTGVLGITGKFASGPDGDPSPMEVVDFDAELTTVGFGSLLTGVVASC